jgi:hypothetical protein
MEVSVFSALLWTQPLSHGSSNTGAGAKLYRSYAFTNRNVRFGPLAMQYSLIVAAMLLKLVGK